MVGTDCRTIDFLLPVSVIRSDGGHLRTACAKPIVDKLLETLCRHHIHVVGTGADLYVSTVTHLHLASLTFLCSDDDYTI